LQTSGANDTKTVSRMRAQSTPTLLCALLLLLAACTNSQPAPQSTTTVNRFDHVDSAHLQPVHFLHKVFPVKKTVSFEFQVPAHTAIPRLYGTFRAFVLRSGQDSLSDNSTNVEFLIMNADQFSDFSRGVDGTAIYTVNPTHDHEVDFLLPPTQDDSATYHITFRNSPGGAAVKQVQADFALNLGYQ
jgi:hypothetical protein